MDRILRFCLSVIEKTCLYGNDLSYGFLEKCQIQLLKYVNELDPVADHKVYVWLDLALNAINAVLFG